MESNGMSARIRSAVDSAVSQASGRVGDLTDATAATAQTLRDGARHVSESTKSGMDDAGSNVKDTLVEAAASARDRATDVASTALETTQATASATKGFLERNPIGLALGAVAVGFLAGLALPVSDVERDNVGPLGERLSLQAKDAATELVAQGKSVVANAVTTALKSSTN